MDILELDLSVRDFNAVKRFGINTTEELIERLSDFCLTARKTGAKVMEVLHERGLLPFHLGEWVEPDRCGEELRPEELQEGEFVIMGFPTESRDWRKIVLIEKIDGETLHYRDGSSGLPHQPISARKVWRIAGERGQALSQTELEALGVPEGECKRLAYLGITNIDGLMQNLHETCHKHPYTVKSVYKTLQKDGRVPFAPGDEPEDTNLIGEELSYSDLQSMPGEQIVYADSEYDAPFVALITRVTDGTVWIWGDLIHPYSVTESEFTEDCKAFRIKANNSKAAESEVICMNEEKTTVIVSEDYTKAVKLTRSIIANAQAAQQSLYEVCKCLKEMKDGKLYKELGYQNFEDYTENEVGIKISQAKKYVAIAEHMTDETASQLAKIQTEKLYMLAMLDEPTRQEITETVNVESVTVKELKAEIAALHQKNTELAEKADQADIYAQQFDDLSTGKMQAESRAEKLIEQNEILSRQVKELESRPVEHAVQEIPDPKQQERIDELTARMKQNENEWTQKFKAAQRESADKLREVQQQSAAELTAMREEYEQQLAEARAAVKPEAVPDTKAVFKAYLANAADALSRLMAFIEGVQGDDNMPLYLSKVDDVIAMTNERRNAL